MKIKLTKGLGRHKAGSVHDVSDALAARHIEKGTAVEVGKRKTEKSPAETTPEGPAGDEPGRDLPST